MNLRVKSEFESGKFTQRTVPFGVRITVQENTGYSSMVCENASADIGSCWACDNRQKGFVVVSVSISLSSSQRSFSKGWVLKLGLICFTTHTKREEAARVEMRRWFKSQTSRS